MTAFVMTNSTAQCVSGNPCQPSGSSGNNALLFQMRGTSVLTNGSVTGSTFSGVRATGIRVITNDMARIGNATGGAIVAPAASNSFTVRDSAFTNNNIAMDFSQSQASNMAFRILNNTTITGHNSHAINFFSAAGATGAASHFHVGIIDGNVIGTQGTKDSGSRIGAGIRGGIQGQNTQGSVTISFNTIREVVNSNVISLFGQQGAAANPTGGSARFKVNNNTMPAPSGSNQSLCGPAATPCAENGIFVLADEAYPVCNVITGNNIYDVTTMNGSFDVYLAERAGPPAGAQLTVEGTGGSNSAYIQANNTLAGPNKFIDEGGNTSQVALGACGTFPSAPATIEIIGTESAPGEMPNGAPVEEAVAPSSSIGGLTSQPFVSLPQPQQADFITTSADAQVSMAAASSRSQQPAGRWTRRPHRSQYSSASHKLRRPCVPPPL